ncbi:hypothetical protein L596_012422 [Steinernema carpocapsae]|uniref:Uncharacterized protein n=1 Tax=Steinernema carpocapsae TaxID=34508 RepID=A0A4U5NXV9_STECR|nr:hypothetical protein L596_012422 [Steinernema carpocapsae]
MSRRATIKTARLEKDRLQQELSNMAYDMECLEAERDRIKRKLHALEQKKSKQLESAKILEIKSKALKDKADEMTNVAAHLRTAVKDAIKLGKKHCADEEC